MAKAQILIVEDDNIVALELRDRLQSLGYAVAGVASYGREAIERAAEMRPDLVLMDIRLKGDVDGIEAAREIRARFGIPVVYLTAYADENTLRRAKVTEPYGYIVKPFQERELHTVIEVVLYNYEMERKLKESERWLSTVLKSIGDAVIATDREGLVAFMNPVAEALTGWKQEDTFGKDLTEVFNIVNEETRVLAESPVTKALREGVVVGLADHSILIAKDGKETHIADSAAPIGDDKGNVTGVVLVFRDITERKRTQKALQESEEKYRALVERSLQGLVIVQDFRIVFANASFAEMSGYTVEELLSLSPEEVRATTYPEDQAFVWGRFRDHLVGKPVPSHYEYRGIRKDGTIRWLEIFASRIKCGGRPAIQGAVVDITERKQAEEEIRQRTAQLEALREVGLELTSQLDLDALFRSIISRAMALVGGESGGLYLYRPDRDVLEWAMTVGPHLAPIGTILQRGEGLSGKVWKTGQPLIVDDYQAWEGRAAVYEGYPFGAVVGMPVRWGEEFLGVLNVLADSPRTFSPADAELLSLFAQQAAIAIENARLYEAERERAEILGALQETALDLAARRALPDLLRAIAARATNLLRAKGASIYFYRPATDDLLLTIDYSVKPEDVGAVLKRGEGLSGKVLETGQPMTVADYSRWEGRSAQFEEVNFAPIVGVPITWGDHLLGVLNVLDDAPRTFSSADIALLERFTPLAAAALEQARLLEEERARRREAETLRQTAAVLSSTLELDEVLGLILQQLRQVIPYNTTSVQLLRDEGLEIVACQGFEKPDQVVGLVFPLDPRFPNHRVVVTKAPLAIEDIIQEYPHFQEEANTYESGHIQSWLGVPLIVKDEVIGMIAVDRVEVHPYTAEEVQLAMAFVNQAAIALNNAQLHQETERLAITDGLTGLYNRRHFYELLERGVESANRYDEHLSLIMLDIDGFKTYNDTCGHLVGDSLLKELAQLLAQDIRKMDIVARYGGDEFVIFLPHTSKKQAVTLAERIRMDVERHRFPGEEKLSGEITISLGVAAYSEDMVEPEALMKAADLALLEAKKERNKVCDYGELYCL